MAIWTTPLGTGTPLPPRVRRKPSVRVGIDGRPVPRLRGRLHEGAVIPTSCIGIGTTLLADGLTARLAIGVFTVSIVAMLTASTHYHCHTSTPEAKLFARRLDHGTILVAIAGTQTAFWLLLGPARLTPWVIGAVWAVTAAGFVHKMTRLSPTSSSGSWLFFVLGWSGIALVPYLVAAGVVVTALVVAGGAAYTLGGILLFRRRGNVWPGVVGYHEIWHAFTIVGFVCHAVALVALTGT